MTDIVTLEWPIQPEVQCQGFQGIQTDEDDDRQFAELMKEEVVDEKQAEMNDAVNLLLKQLDEMKEHKPKETQTQTDEVIWPYTCKPMT